MRHEQRASALVETAMSGLLASMLLTGSLFVGRLSLAARRAHAVARHGAALSAVGVPSGALDGELRDYAARMNVSSATWVLDRYVGSSAAAFYRLAESVVAIPVPLPPAMGGGSQTVVERAVVEEDRP